MVHLTVNLDKYLHEFQQQLANHLTSLSGTLRSLEDGSLLEKAALKRPYAIIHFQVGVEGGMNPDMVGDACNRCFLDLTRSLINYMDRMISIRRLKGTEINFPSDVQSNEKLQAFVSAHLESCYRDVASDRSLTNPRKLRELAGLGSFEHETALSYFQLRRCLEHHGAVPTSNITIYFIRPVILAGDEEITKLPHVVPENASINLRIDRPALLFPTGQRVFLTEADLENVYTTLGMLIGPEIRRVVSESI